MNCSAVARGGAGGGGGEVGPTNNFGEKKVLIDEFSIYRRIARIFSGGCVLKIKIQTCRGVRGHAPPGKILETLNCLGLHFTRFHCGERQKDNVE